MSEQVDSRNADASRFRKHQLRLAEDVRRALEREGRHHPAVIAALERVPRQEFVPPASVDVAFRNSPLPIGCNQTISQPTVVALMIGALHLRPEYRVLEIGTGSGYAAAILAELAKEVYTVERHESLAAEAKLRLRALKYDNVHVRHGDGREGWIEHAPYHGIVAAAASRDVPAQLLRQLRIGGRLVIPIDVDDGHQRLLVTQRTMTDEYHTRDLGDVRFVPLTAGVAE